MAECCDPRGCDEVFGTNFARQMAKRFRRRGLDATARRMVDFLAADGLRGATVLDIGGGVGEIGIELLKRGAAKVTTLELSAAYDGEARRLAEEAGVSDRAHRRVADLAASPEEVGPADLVVLHRVVCCYPDYVRLLSVAANHSRRRLVFSHPPRHAFSRVVVTLQNAALRIMRQEYRAFVHPPDAMAQVAIDQGMRSVLVAGGTVWQVRGLVR